MFAPSITKEEIMELPLRQFEGKIVVVSAAAQIREAAREIADTEWVGFDTETRPVFVKGQYNPVSLVQVALEEKVFLFRILQTGLTDELLEIFQHRQLAKIGAALRDDIKALQKIQPFEPAAFEDLNLLAKQAGIESEGVRKLTALVLGFRVSKSAQTSNWEADTLTEKQVRYAATDAWVCLEIYKKLKFQGFI
jgi:ribonuclease D